MFKRDPILKGWDLEIDKDSKKYKEMKAMFMEFEREFQLQKKELPYLKSNFPFHTFTSNLI